MPNSAEAVAIVVVTYNSAPLLADLIDSLPAGLGRLESTLIVVDNASTDGSLDTARRLCPDAVFVQTGRNAGYAAGINAGVAAAPPHGLILVLNPDVRLLPECVPALVEALRIPGTGIAVPHLIDRNGERIDTLRREPSIARALADAFLGARRAGRIRGLGENISDESAYKVMTTADWAEGSTLLISTECWQQCGAWDESFFLYSEETEFALRARDHGLVTRYTPTANAIHLEGDSGQSPPLWALLTMNKVRLYRRRHGQIPGRVYWGALLLRESIRAAMGKSTSKAAVRALLSPSRMRETPGPHSLRTAKSASNRQDAPTPLS